MTSALTTALVTMLLAASLPVAASAQEATPCDGDFHIVHDLGENGQLLDVDFAGGVEGWAVGFDYEHEPIGSGVSALSHGPDERPAIVRFDDSGWEHIVPPHEKGTELNAVAAITSDDVWTVGQFSPTYKKANAIAYHWDGSTWTEMTVSRRGRVADLTDVVALASDDVWAVGFYERRRRRVETLVAHYDGTGWSHVPAPSPAKVALLNGIDASASDDVWAVGEWKWGHPLVLRWNGTRWRHVKLGRKFRGEEQAFSAVDVVGNRELWATGHSSLVVHLDDGRWRREETPNPRGTENLNGIAVEGDQGWAVGMRFVPDRGYTWATRLVAGEWERVSFEGPRFGEIQAVAIDGAGTAWAVGDTFTGDPTYESKESIQRACT